MTVEGPVGPEGRGLAGAGGAALSSEAKPGRVVDRVADRIVADEVGAIGGRR